LFFHRIAAALAVLVSSLAFSATVAERSPFTQGHWWDSNRSGSGFELFNVGPDAMAIWYTFDEAGRPVWYTAQGPVGDTEPWPLLKHRWLNGRHDSFETVGTLRLTVRNPELVDAAFQIGSRSGTWSIRPFNNSGVSTELDHTGSYFNPANSGWGFTLTQQGDVLGGVLYTYDASGAPTWYAGFDRGNPTSVGFIAATGSCPACTYSGTLTQSVGRITFEFRSEREVVLRSQLAPPMAAGVNVDGARLVQLGRPASARPADRMLATFEDDASLKAFLGQALLNLPPTPAGVDYSPAPPAGSFSTTNLQEAGVDEADVSKTDGSFIYTFATSQYGAMLSSVRVARVGGEGASVDVLGTVALAGGASAPVGNAGLYVRPGQLIALTGTLATSYGFSVWGTPTAWMRGKTNIEIFDTSGAGLPASVWKAQVDGYLVSSRRIGDRLYVVSRYVPFLPGFAYGNTTAAGIAANQQVFAATPLAALLPSISINGATPISIVASSSVFVPPQGSRPVTADMVVVYAIDLPSGRVAQSLAILGSAETVYASTDNLYVATSRYVYRNPSGALLPEQSFYTTDINQIRLGADSLTVVGTGSVEGLLGYDPNKAAFRLSEHQGRVRVVTSTNSMWGASMKNRLTILEPSTLAPGLLKTVSYLPNPQRPDSLGKPGELLYSTRFLGDRLYAVTFKKVDPLYVVDLANAADPKITGALEIPGFSEYLHPLPNGLLLGFGKDARPASGPGDGDFAWYQGLQLTLFDVSGTGTPREMQRVLVGKRGSGSALLGNHRAFSSLARADGSLSVAIPARIHDGTPMYGTGDSAFYPWLESGLLRFTVQGTGPNDARLVQSESLITHRASPSSGDFYYDPAVSSARSVLFRDATIYIGNGQFWRQDAAGNTFGPF
jgi:uncharacterized secreted protein with C-terminal beta-propeller domain